MCTFDTSESVFWVHPPAGQKFWGPLLVAATSHLDPTSQFGDYVSDLAQKKYTLSWDSLQTMELWLQKEQTSKFVELWTKETIWNTKSERWIKKQVYVYSPQGTGGTKKYKKKCLKQDKKILDKRLEDGCGSHLIVKSYPNMECILGHYQDQHTHPIGAQNGQFMCLPDETHLQIAELIRLDDDEGWVKSQHLQVLANIYLAKTIHKY